MTPTPILEKRPEVSRTCVNAYGQLIKRPLKRKKKKVVRDNWNGVKFLAICFVGSLFWGWVFWKILELVF